MRFASGGAVAEQAAAISELMKRKQLHQASRHPLFQEGIQKLLTTVRQDEGGMERAVAAAIVLRIAALVKPWKSRIADALKVALVERPVSLGDISDPDDRFYLATCWRILKQPWMREYLSAAAVQEDGSERVRLECVEGVFALSPDLVSVLAELTPPLRRLQFRTEKPGDSKARRLRRVLEAVNKVYAAKPKDPGQLAGERVRQLILESLRNVPPAVTSAVIDELAEEALGLVHNIVRARFSFATLPETFVAMEVVRTWYRDYDWEEFVERSPAARLIARDLEEALELLVRAGVPDSGLYSLLVLACGTEASARKCAGQILARNPGLPEDLAHWLSGSPARRKSKFDAELQAAEYDEFLANFMIDCEKLRDLEAAFERDIMPEISVTVPRAATQLSILSGHLRSIRNAIDAAAGLRSMALRGHTGEIVTFSPLEHEVVGGPRPGVRSVRIIRPAVEAPGVGGGRRIVRKAIVEPVE